MGVVLQSREGHAFPLRLTSDDISGGANGFTFITLLFHKKVFKRGYSH